MLALSAVKLAWWTIGGLAVIAGVIQIASALGGPRERRPTAVIGVLVVLLGGLALLMPAFGSGDAPPGRGGTMRGQSSRAITAWSEVPFAALLDALPGESFKLDALQSEIIARLHDGDADEHDLRALLELCLAGSGDARPPTDAWQDRYARLLGAIDLLEEEQRLVVPPELTERWLDLPPAYELRTRRRWPEGINPVVQVRARDFWPGRQLVVRATLRDDESAAAEFIADDAWSLTGLDLAPGPHEIVIDVELRRISMRARPGTTTFGPLEILGSDVITLPVEVGGTIEDVLPPVSMTAMDAILRDGLAITFEQERFARPSLVIDTSATKVPVFDGVAIGLRLDVVQGDVVLDSVPCAWPGGPGETMEPIRVALAAEAAAALARDDAPPAVVVLRPDPAAALWVIDATRHWSGAVTVPLR